MAAPVQIVTGASELAVSATNPLATTGGTGSSANQVQGNVAAGAADSGNPVKTGGVYVAAGALITTGQRGDTQLDAYGNTKMVIGFPNTNAYCAGTGANADAASGAATGLNTAGFGFVYNGSTWDRMRGTTTGLSTVAKSTTTGGLTPIRVVTGTTGVIKGGAGQLYTLTVANLNAAVRYLQLYNKATAPTLSTDTPVYTIPLAASGRLDINFTEIGLAFATGISWAYTTDDIAIPTTAGTSTELHFSASYT